jgi:hypothetical protein
MTHKHDETEKKLQLILQQAYRSHPTFEEDQIDPRAIMRRIHSLPKNERETGAGETLDRLFWRLTPMAGALIAILAVVILNLDFIPDAEAWSTLTYEKDAADIIQLFMLRVTP